jgi:hypothetical protein
VQEITPLHLYQYVAFGALQAKHGAAKSSILFPFAKLAVMGAANDQYLRN